VSSLTIIAIGAAGGSCTVDRGGTEGAGAALTASVPVAPRETLLVGVGTPGAPCQPSGGAGGSGGGGSGGNAGFGGAGGGGASLVGLASTPSPSFGSQLLVVAGAGGGAAQDADGGNAGFSGENPGGGGGGGAPGTSTSGGAGGVGSFGGPGAPGQFAIGGAGGGGPACNEPKHLGAGGGGGGGYFGGGGGGCGVPPGAGGGGSSFVVPGGTTLLGPTPTSSAAAVSITYPAPTAAVSSSAITFAPQPPGLAAPEQVLTVSNKGSATLIVTGVQLGGPQPDDFLIDDRCQQPVTVGSSCQVGVRFDPQAGGNRAATLKLVTNAARPPTVVALSGTGVGALAGARRHAVEVVSCRSHIQDERHPPVKAETCTGELVHGVLKLARTGNWTRATIARGHVVYATGASMSTAHGRSELLLTARRVLKAGRYTLILRDRRGRRLVVTRRAQILLR
jgi:hypothetical protein